MTFNAMRSLLSLCLAICIVAAPAHSQTPPSDPARVEAAKELMVAMNIQEQFQKTTTAMKNMLVQQMQAQPGGDKVKALLDKIFDPQGAEIKTYFQDAEAAYVAFFAERFTVDELKQIATFQGSEVGKKMQGAMPDMITALGPPLAKFQESVKKQIVEELQAKPQP